MRNLLYCAGNARYILQYLYISYPRSLTFYFINYDIVNNYDKMQRCVSKALLRRSNISQIAMQTRFRHIISHVNSTDAIEEVKRRNKQRRLEVGNLTMRERRSCEGRG